MFLLWGALIGGAAYLALRRRVALGTGGLSMGDLSAHFSAREFFSRSRPLAAGTDALYAELARATLEPAREIAAAVAGAPISARVLSGQRLPDHNSQVGGAVNSYHLPPADRPDAARRGSAVAADLQFVLLSNGQPLTGAQHREIASRVRAAMSARSIPAGGATAYHTSWAPGLNGKAPFVHLDNRGTITDWE